MSIATTQTSRQGPAMNQEPAHSRFADALPTEQPPESEVEIATQSTQTPPDLHQAMLGNQAMLENGVGPSRPERRTYDHPDRGMIVPLHDRDHRWGLALGCGLFSLGTGYAAWQMNRAADGYEDQARQAARYGHTKTSESFSKSARDTRLAGQLFGVASGASFMASVSFLLPPDLLRTKPEETPPEY